MVQSYFEKNIYLFLFFLHVFVLKIQKSQISGLIYILLRFIFNMFNVIDFSIWQELFRIIRLNTYYYIFWIICYAFEIGTALSTNFDMTLMICLIRHLTPIPISDGLPFPTDISEGADLSRLKYYRNQVAHCDDGVLSDNQLNDYWTDISQVNSCLNNYMFSKYVCSIHKNLGSKHKAFKYKRLLQQKYNVNLEY